MLPWSRMFKALFPSLSLYCVMKEMLLNNKHENSGDQHVKATPCTSESWYGEGDSRRIYFARPVAHTHCWSLPVGGTSIASSILSVCVLLLFLPFSLLQNGKSSHSMIARYMFPWPCFVNAYSVLFTILVVFFFFKSGQLTKRKRGRQQRWTFWTWWWWWWRRRRPRRKWIWTRWFLWPRWWLEHAWEHVWRRAQTKRIIIGWTKRSDQRNSHTIGKTNGQENPGQV